MEIPKFQRELLKYANFFHAVVVLADLCLAYLIYSFCQLGSWRVGKTLNSSLNSLTRSNG